jgi:hypothetical protein
MKLYSFLSTLCLALLINVSAFSQSPFLDLKIVETTDYKTAVGTFTFSFSENMYVVTSPHTVATEADIRQALVTFVNILQPEKSYIIQHDFEGGEPYYFVFHYDSKDNRYLVMDNSIGEKNEPVYRVDFSEAKSEMLQLLRVIYTNSEK